MDSQKNTVLYHLQVYGSITSMEAIMEYGITRLADVVWKLRKDGYAIVSHDEYGINRYGRKVSFSRYTLEDERHDA